MPAVKPETHRSVILRKDLLNIFLFIASVASVVGLIVHGKEASAISVAGTLIFVAFFYFVLYLFLLQFRREVLQVSRKTFFILVTIFSFLVITKIITGQPRPNLIYLVPFAIIPVIIRTFYDAMLALFILLITIILAGFIIPEPFEFILMSFISGMISVFTLTNVYSRVVLLFTSLMVILSYTVMFLGITLMKGENPVPLFKEYFLMFTGNGIMILLSYPLMLIFENKFLFISDATLLELADTNQPILRKLAEEAPGSFQHSLQVANLAEEAARIVGANHILVKTGALYHDIGKTANPKYFIENQTDELNPHDKLDPKASSRLIINHVKNGVVLARNFKIPVQIIDFIRTHHGTTTAYFFYKKYVDLYPDRRDMRKFFTYPGPKPFTKETAIVMMADAVEASSRTLTKYSEEEINDLVDRIIYLQEQDDQFSDVPLTYKDISDIKGVFKKRLSNIYHARVAYPDRS